MPLTRAISSFGRIGRVPVLGVGCATFGGAFGEVDFDDIVNVVGTAIDDGMPYFDTSPYYGDSERVLGDALRAAGRDRKDYMLATKCGRYGEPGTPGVVDFSAKRCQASVAESLDRLGTDYIDIIQVHDIDFADPRQIAQETLPALAELQQKGIVKHLGITGYPLEKFMAVIEQSPATIDMILSYGRLNLFDNTLLDLVPYFKNRDIAVVNASPLGMGMLTADGPPPWNSGRPEKLVAAARAAARICKEAGTTLPQVALQYSTQWAATAGILTLVGIRTHDDLLVNMSSISEPLPEAEFNELVSEICCAFGSTDPLGKHTALSLVPSTEHAAPHNQPFSLNLCAF
eukprot:g3410.t1